MEVKNKVFNLFHKSRWATFLFFGMMTLVCGHAQAHERSFVAPKEQIPPKDSSADSNILKAALKGWNISLGAGLSIGGTSPIPLPITIRKIESYNPQLNTYLQGEAHKHFVGPWGMTVGLRFETRGMKTSAEVKNYHMEITEEDGGHMEGGWYGGVVTKVRNIYATIPVLASYTFRNKRWILRTGPYVSYLLNGEFSGSVSDGYIRTPNELGENVDVTHATYDFSSSLRRFQWGWQLGGTFSAYKHLYVDASLNWGLNSIFPKDFETIKFSLYPIYANVGFSYLF